MDRRTVHPTPGGTWLSEEKIVKFAAWTHPRTGETRVYINGVSGAEKAYIAPLNSGEPEGPYTVKCFGLYPSQLDELMNSVEDELAVLNNGDRPFSFTEVVAIISK
jgi:hypothetical protein